MAMLFFKTQKPRKFNHQPIFFNPDAEALEERVQKIKKEMGMAEPQEYSPEIKGKFAEQTEHIRRRQEEAEKTATSKNIKIAIALAALLLLFYYFFMR